MSDELEKIVSNISHAAMLAGQAWQDAGYEQSRPCVIFKPKLFRDGDKWCVLFGDNLQEGVAGFGACPHQAMLAFDRAWIGLEVTA